MKVLFVSSGNSDKGITSIILNQGASLKKQGIEIDYFALKGKGLKGYLRNILLLHKYLRINTYDVVHAHYSLSAFVASLAGAKPQVVSLMGSDVQSGKYYKYLIHLFNKLFWKVCIVKSEEMKAGLGLKNIEVIPNGVDLSIFQPIPKHLAIEKAGFNPEKKNVLFAANPARYEKNFKLAEKAFTLLEDKNVELHFLKNIPHDLMPYYFNASDVVLLTSLWEGSPNVIKEAMACNRPIVATNVGDIRSIIGETRGCFVSDFSANDVANKLHIALNFSLPTEGRTNIAHLDDEKVALKIISIYKNLAIGKQK